MAAFVFTYPATIEPDEGGRFLVRFRDLPEALTDGTSLAEAQREAGDCLAEAIAARIADQEDIPAPSRARSREDYPVPLETSLALKAAIYAILRDRSMTIADLARLVDVDHKEARRMLDPDHPTKVPTLEAALARLGYDVEVKVIDTARPDRITRPAPRSGSSESASTLRPRRAAALKRRNV